MSARKEPNPWKRKPTVSQEKIKTINGSRITHRELECLKLIGAGFSYKRICIEMGFSRETAVNSLIGRLRDKLKCTSQVEIALTVIQIGLI